MSLEEKSKEDIVVKELKNGAIKITISESLLGEYDIRLNRKVKDFTFKVDSKDKLNSELKNIFYDELKDEDLDIHYERNDDIVFYDWVNWNNAAKNPLADIEPLGCIFSDGVDSIFYLLIIEIKQELGIEIKEEVEVEEEPQNKGFLKKLLKR